LFIQSAELKKKNLFNHKKGDLSAKVEERERGTLSALMWLLNGFVDWFKKSFLKKRDENGERRKGRASKWRRLLVKVAEPRPR